MLIALLALLSPLALAQEVVSFRRSSSEPVLEGWVDGLDLLALPEGGWRLYFGVEGRGVQSDKGPDLTHLVPEKGMRLAAAEDTHPAVLRMPSGEVLMVVQVRPAGGQRGQLALSRSADGGKSWASAQVIVGSAQGFSHAGSADLFALPDGGVGLLFSGEKQGQKGTSIYRASSKDGLAFLFDADPVVEEAHSPTVLPMDEGWMGLLYHQGDRRKLAYTHDQGRTFQPGVASFLDSSGQIVPPPPGPATAVRDAGGRLMVLVPSDRGVYLYTVGDLRPPTGRPGPMPRGEGPPLAMREGPRSNLPEPGGPDAGRPDAGRPDAGRPDAVRPDAGRPREGGSEGRAPGQPEGEEQAPKLRKEDEAPPEQVGEVLPELFPKDWVRAPSEDIKKAEHGILAADIVALNGSGYRAFYTVEHEGIGSSASGDGSSWTREKGVRLESTFEKGDLEGITGHPTVIRIGPSDLRMYYQAADPGVRSKGGAPSFQVYSAVSHDDGLTWTREGVRIAANDETGLDHAAHGRVWKRRDGGLAMVFSAGKSGERGPSDIFMATSPDGLAWTVRPEPLFRSGHDPDVLRMPDGRLVMVFNYLNIDFRVSESADDGEHWGPAAPLTLTDADGGALDEAARKRLGDVAIHLFPDGRIGLWVNGVDGIAAYEANEPKKDRKTRKKGLKAAG